MVGPAALRQAVAHLKAAFGVSERRACSIIKADRKSVRYRSCRQPDTALRERLRALAVERRRFGYRRLFVLLRREGEPSGKMRDELLNESLFFSLDHARQKVAAWALDYNTRRPHSSIGYLTPEAFAASLTATGRPAAQDESCAARPVAHPTLRGVTNPRTLVAAG